jgi:hypothetical protein
MFSLASPNRSCSTRANEIVERSNPRIAGEIRVELACRKDGGIAGRCWPDEVQHTHGSPGRKRARREIKRSLGARWARWKVARLRSRAERAERRAAAAIRDASAIFSAALEAVLHAAVARVKADEACLGFYRASSPLRSDRTSPDAPSTM